MKFFGTELRLSSHGGTGLGRLAGAAVLTGGLLLGPAVMAGSAGKFVVIGAELFQGPRVGEVISDAYELTLDEGESLTLVGEAGEKVMLNGPHDGPISTVIPASPSDEAAQEGEDADTDLNLVATLSHLFADGNGQAVFRSVGGQATAPTNPWSIDVQRDGVHCVDPGNVPLLWRPPRKLLAAVTVRNEPTAQEARVAWATDKNEVPWPIEVSIEDGVQYSLKAEPATMPTLLEIRSVPAGMPTRMHAAAWMSDNDCKEQARLLVLSADIDKLIGDLAEEGKF